ncbi:MAG: hypothetical protein ACRDXB_10940, partial [Actinomycetes bacterium]
VGAITLPLALGLGAAAAYGVTAVDYTEIPLTQGELAANWSTDRAVPSGGYESVTFDGRSDVLEVRIDKDNRATSPSGFLYTEGILRQVDAVAATKIDLYVDQDWLDKGTDVRAGFWGVGHDDNGDRTAFPIIEFTTAGDGDFTGWRVWDDLTGWHNHPEIPYEPGEWSTLEIELNEAEGTFDLAIDGSPATSPAAGSTNLGEVIVNSFNYGPDAQSYDVHWSNFATGVLDELDSKDECKDGGFAAYGFANQGQCVSSLMANR